jgi:hypothetical protein
MGNRPRLRPSMPAHLRIWLRDYRCPDCDSLATSRLDRQGIWHAVARHDLTCPALRGHLDIRAPAVRVMQDAANEIGLPVVIITTSRPGDGQ